MMSMEFMEIASGWRGWNVGGNLRERKSVIEDNKAIKCGRKPGLF